MPTSYEIYQTYLRGPAAVIRLFEQSLGTQAIYGSPDPDMQRRAIEDLSALLTCSCAATMHGNCESASTRATLRRLLL